MLKVRGLSKTYLQGEVTVDALLGVDLDVQAGELVAVMGPSGSGKSTLLQLVGGLDTPTRGLVKLGDVETTGLNAVEMAAMRRTRIGYVFQDYNLIAGFTARENVGLPLEFDGVRGAQLAQLANEALQLVGLDGLGDRYPDQLSGGQRQRVAIARSLIGTGRLLLADEPTGALDSETAQRVLKVIRERVDGGAAALVATHDAGVARWADRILRLRDGAVVSNVGGILAVAGRRERHGALGA